MRLPLPVRPKSRFPQDEARVPLKVMRPLKLRNEVSGKGNNLGQASCIQELTVMLSCFKLNEFNDAACPQELKSFQKCIIESEKLEKEKKEQIKKGITVGAKRLHHLQINQILKKYPKS